MRESPRAPALAVLLLGCLGAGATALVLSAHLPPAAWIPALIAPAPDDLPQLLVHDSVLPRLAVALLAGAGLALAGAVLQQTLRNPLASPTTLGIEAGAQLALALATLVAPALLGPGRDAVALAGGAGAVAIVFGLSWRDRLAPLTVILAGMVVAMVCGAAAAGLSLLNEEALRGLTVWGSGALNQQDWSVAAPLAGRVLVLAGPVALLARPLQLLDLDESARSLGLSVARIRLVGLGLAVALTAAVVSAVGVIGFVGLAAPALARALGLHRFGPRLLWSGLLGAGLLWVTDAGLQAVEALAGVNVPTGAATALLGAPILLWLMPRLRLAPAAEPVPAATPRRARTGGRLVALALLAPLLGLACLVVGPSPGGGLAVARLSDLAPLLPWRWPRTLAAGSAGAMLAVAGLLLQQLTRNPVAGPEVLGVSSGAALGLVLVLFLAATPTYGLQVAAAALGSAAVAGTLLALGRRAAGPDQILITGIALGALFSAGMAVLAAGGDPRLLLVASWLAGSLSDVSPQVAVGAAASAAILVPACLLLVRWLDLAVLGPGAMRALGVCPRRASLAILALAAALTAAATLAVGPLSFVGFVAPHLARRLGFARAGERIAASALIGAGLLVAADGIGRVLAPPFQVPAGLIGTVLAGPLLIGLLQPGRRRGPA
ncbi:Fe(3+)-hydroxamate ABC transporter permease FhuB [Methylobacterium sp. JK268]